MVSQVYPSEFQLNKTNISDTDASFSVLHLSFSNDIVSTKIYNKRDDFDFEIVSLSFLDADVPREFILINSSDLREHLAMLQISPLAINFKVRNFLNKDIARPLGLHYNLFVSPSVHPLAVSENANNS